MSTHKTYLNNNGYNISIKYLTTTQIKKIETDLTVVPKMQEPSAEEIKAAEFPLYDYSDDGNAIIVPRYYGVSRFGHPEHTDFEEAEEIDIKFVKSLREKQMSVVNLCIQYMLKNGGGLLSVPCGFGKTVCALYIAQALGLKTLVVVHKTFLLEQWIDRAVEFLNIKRENIGVIRQNKCEIVGKDIVIGVIHTMSKRPYNELYRQFGLVIYDEAHHVGARFFAKTLMKTCCNYTLALTATPYRSDGLIKVMYWYTGGTIYREAMKMNCNVIIKSITHTSTDDKRFRMKQRWFKGRMRPHSQSMTYNMLEIDSRNRVIIDMITYIRRNYPERKMLILSERIDHLNLLKEAVDQKIHEDVVAGLIDENDVYSCYYIGETKSHERQEAEERGDIIFATYQMASEGLDIKHLNTLLFGSPKKDVVQTVGRIMRRILEVGDVRPMIIDFHDDIDLFSRWYNIRNEYFQKCKYQIENYYLIDDQFVTGNKYYGLDNISDDDRDRHHPDISIHKMINDMNYEYNEIKEQHKIFEDICSEYENMGIVVRAEQNKRNNSDKSDKSDNSNKNDKRSNIRHSVKKMKQIMFDKTKSSYDSDEKSYNSESDIGELNDINDISDINNIYLTNEDIIDKYGLREFEQNNDLRILEDFEPYKMEDILHVDRLTVSDFTRTILKNANVDEKIDLDKDMHLDAETDFDNEMMKYRGRHEVKSFREKIKTKRFV